MNGMQYFYYNIADTFVKAGYDVEIITSYFQHFTKKQNILSHDYPFKIRILNNIKFAHDVKKYLHSREKDCDAIYLAAEVAAFCHENNISFIADIEYLLHGAMYIVIKNLAAIKKYIQLLTVLETLRTNIQ